MKKGQNNHHNHNNESNKTNKLRANEMRKKKKKASKAHALVCVIVQKKKANHEQLSLVIFVAEIEIVKSFTIASISGRLKGFTRL